MFQGAEAIVNGYDNVVPDAASRLKVKIQQTSQNTGKENILGKFYYINPCKIKKPALNHRQNRVSASESEKENPRLTSAKSQKQKARGKTRQPLSPNRKR